MAKSILPKANMIGGIIILVLGILLVAGVLSLDMILGLALIAIGLITVLRGS